MQRRAKGREPKDQSRNQKTENPLISHASILFALEGSMSHERAILPEATGYRAM